MNFYILNKGETKGPYSLDDLRKMQITRSTYIWKQGMDNWIQAANVDELDSLLNETPPDIPSMPKNNLLISILAAIFCCLPFGIAGIYNSIKVSEAYEAGDYDKANILSNRAEKWCIISFYFALLLFLLSALVISIIAFSQYLFHNQIWIK